MVKVRCQDCGRTVETEKDKDISKLECKECRGDMALLNSDDDTYKDDNEDEEESEEVFECEECGEVYSSEEDLIFFKYQEIYICKKCIDKAYPRKIEVKTEYKEKIIEKPIIKYLNKEGKEVKIESSIESKSRFD
jgi:hypothetical protein